MKKIYLIFCLLITGTGAFAQAIANAGMESWRTSTSGTSPSFTIHAPTMWYGFDSLIIADGESFAALIGAGTNWHAQLFQEGTIVHGGSSSAKLITLKQDTLGYFAGTLSNAAIAVNVATLIGGGSFASATTFSGGTPITQRVASVSAWVQYHAGVGGLDSGELVVTVYQTISGYDSAVGSATLLIPPTGSSWTQVTANVNYVDSVDGADTIRMQFASSTNTNPRDSSTLYVDDVSMIYAPLGVKNVNVINDVKVYPNPASGILYIDGVDNAGADFRLFAMNGQQVLAQTLTGKDRLDVSYLPDGLYFYTISDTGGNTVQRGKVSVVK